MISKEDFLALARTGWEKYGYESGYLYRSGPGSRSTSSIIYEDTESACIVGAAAAADFVIGADAWKWAGYNLSDMPNHMWSKIVHASNNAGSIEEALVAVEALDWSAT